MAGEATRFKSTRSGFATRAHASGRMRQPGGPPAFRGSSPMMKSKCISAISSVTRCGSGVEADGALRGERCERVLGQSKYTTHPPTRPCSAMNSTASRVGASRPGAFGIAPAAMARVPAPASIATWTARIDRADGASSAGSAPEPVRWTGTRGREHREERMWRSLRERLPRRHAREHRFGTVPPSRAASHATAVTPRSAAKAGRTDRPAGGRPLRDLGSRRASPPRARTAAAPVGVGDRREGACGRGSPRRARPPVSAGPERLSAAASE